jgi:hypothetical protein
MKKNYFFLTIILLTCSISIFFISCSKRKNELPAPANEPTATAGIPVQRIGNRGSVAGVVLPLRSLVKIAVYDDNFKSYDFYYHRDLSFQMDRIPSGIYTLMVLDLLTGKEYFIAGIKISTGVVTDVGIISLK